MPRKFAMFPFSLFVLVFLGVMACEPQPQAVPQTVLSTPDKLPLLGGATIVGEAVALNKPLPPGDGFSSVSVGSSHACAVKTDGTVLCWGSDENSKAAPPEGRFAEISVGNAHSCAISVSKSVVCWGNNEWGQATPVHRLYTSISAGASHTCGVKTDNFVACWGSNDEGQSAPPTGLYRSVSAGQQYTCGLTSDMWRAVCWGADFWKDDAFVYRKVKLLPTFLNGNFRTISAGTSHTCGIRRTTAVCWGGSYYLPGPGPKAQPPAAHITEVKVGHVYTCGLSERHQLLCWGYHRYGHYITIGKPGEYLTLDVGSYGVCAVRTDGTLSCWAFADLRIPTDDRR